MVRSPALGGRALEDAEGTAAGAPWWKNKRQAVGGRDEELEVSTVGATDELRVVAAMT